MADKEVSGVQIRKSLDSKDDGAQVVLKGRVYKIEMEITVPEEASVSDISEALAYHAFQSGGMDNTNPADGAIDGDITSITDLGRTAYVLWNAKGEGGEKGRRRGKVVQMPDGQKLSDHFEYQAPGEETA